MFISLSFTSLAFSQECKSEKPTNPKQTSKSPAISQTIYNGLITLKNSAYWLQIKNSGAKYKLTFVNSQMERVIKRLASGDFVSVQTDGIITNSSNEPTLKVISLNYIGLNVLLGTWTGSDKTCYYFKNFTTFYIFNRNNKGLCTLPDNVVDSKIYHPVNYFVNPDDEQWILLISDNQSQYAAELLINSTTNLQLNLFDHETGNTINKVILRR